MMRGIALAVCALCLSGCAATAMRSHEGRLAVQASAVILAAEGVLSGTEAAVEAQVLTPAQALPVARVAYSLGVLGQQLAGVLRVLDSLTASGAEKATASREAAALLGQMEQAVATIGTVPRAALRPQVVTLTSALASTWALLPR
jgi:hypothetical protein